MLQFLLILIPIFILLILSAVLNNLFKYYIESALFITTLSIPLIIIIFGLLGLLTVGYFSIVLLSLLSLAYLFKSKYDFKKIFSTGIVGYLLVVTIFAFIVRDFGLRGHDEIAHWALATKNMLFSGEYYKGIQGTLSPTFNFFITKSSYFSPGQMYVGSWMIIWAAFLLPIGGLDWSKWKRVFVYLFASFCISMFLYPTVGFHNDELMGIMGGGARSILGY